MLTKLKCWLLCLLSSAWFLFVSVNLIKYHYKLQIIIQIIKTLSWWWRLASLTKIVMHFQVLLYLVCLPSVIGCQIFDYSNQVDLINSKCLTNLFLYDYVTIYALVDWLMFSRWRHQRAEPTPPTNTVWRAAGRSTKVVSNYCALKKSGWFEKN